MLTHRGGKAVTITQPSDKEHKERVSDLVDNKLLDEHDRVITVQPAISRHEVEGEECTFVVLASAALSAALTPRQVVDAVDKAIKVVTYAAALVPIAVAIALFLLLLAAAAAAAVLLLVLRLLQLPFACWCCLLLLLLSPCGMHLWPHHCAAACKACSLVQTNTHHNLAGINKYLLTPESGTIQS